MVLQVDGQLDGWMDGFLGGVRYRAPLIGKHQILKFIPSIPPSTQALRSDLVKEKRNEMLVTHFD